MNKFKITSKICFVEPLKLTVGETFLHPVTKQAFRIVDFPYSTLPTILNLETGEVGVITQKRTGNFRQLVDVYKDQTVQLCDVVDDTSDDDFIAEIIELEERLKTAAESDEESQQEIALLKRKLSEKDNELSINGKAAKEIVELAKAIAGIK